MGAVLGGTSIAVLTYMGFDGISTLSEEVEDPRRNILLIALCGAFLISYGLGAEILNFGALFAYMGVNAAALARYYVRNPERRLRDFWLPAAGFVTCLLLWLNLSNAAKIVGGSWMIAGVIVGALRTRGFRQGVLRFEASTDDQPTC